MPTTTLYTVHILPARPFSRTATTPVDIKHSAFKSLSAFLRASEKGGLLKLKDARPDVVVAAVFPTHVDVVAHHLHHTFREEDERRRRVEEREARQAAEATNAEKAITVTELWKPHLSTLPLFAALELESVTAANSFPLLMLHNRSTTALYPHAEVKSALLAYVEKHDLVNRFEQQYINVSSDAVLSAALYGSPNTKGSTPAPEFAKREAALSALCDHMQPWHRIAIPGDEPITKKGALRPISVTSRVRQGRRGKACTHITGFEPYQLSAETLADALRVRCASSTSGMPYLSASWIESRSDDAYAKCRRWQAAGKR
jgi:translation initiation factor 2D